MGKIIRGAEAWSQVKLSTKRTGGGGSCSAEFVAYLACLDRSQGNEDECRPLREALRKCMFAAHSGPKANRHKAPINYHLQKVCASTPCPRACAALAAGPTPGVLAHWRAPFVAGALARALTPLPAVAQFIKGFKR